MTGHLGYESTGLTALRGQNNVQGLNDSGANPAYLHGYQAVDEPEIRKKFSEAWAWRRPRRLGYWLDQMMSGLHDRRIKALYLIGENPAQTEPNAHHVEEGLANLEFMVSQDIFLNDMTERFADVAVLPASSFAEKDGQALRTPSGGSTGCAPVFRAPPDRLASIAIPLSTWPALGANWPDYPDAESVWNEMADLAPAWYGIRYDWLEEQDGGLRPSAPSRLAVFHAGRPAWPGGRGKPSSSTSRRSSNPTPSTCSSSTPVARSTTTTRRRRRCASRASPTSRRSRSSRSAEDASNLGLSEGDWARISSRRGSLEARASSSPTASTPAWSGWRCTSRAPR